MPVDEAMRKWILDQYAAGFAQDQIRASLQQAGYDPRMADEVLGDVREEGVVEESARPEHAQAVAPAKKRGFNWTIVFAIVLVGVFVLALVFFTGFVNNLVASALRPYGFSS
ncbi:MAG: hypothetical protein HYS81_03555 [Candidatus Aenigmatarchaeota archaeon]|nr:MAG: hypothetical protein HYS81_03555 [Candidatus Aenigmarchaeota archaeon]